MKFSIRVLTLCIVDAFVVNVPFRNIFAVNLKSVKISPGMISENITTPEQLTLDFIEKSVIEQYKAKHPGSSAEELEQLKDLLDKRIISNSDHNDEKTTSLLGKHSFSDREAKRDLQQIINVAGTRHNNELFEIVDVFTPHVGALRSSFTSTMMQIRNTVSGEYYFVSKVDTGFKQFENGTRQEAVSFAIQEIAELVILELRKANINVVQFLGLGFTSIAVPTVWHRTAEKAKSMKLEPSHATVLEEGVEKTKSNNVGFIRKSKSEMVVQEFFLGGKCFGYSERHLWAVFTSAKRYSTGTHSDESVSSLSSSTENCWVDDFDLKSQKIKSTSASLPVNFVQRFSLAARAETDNFTAENISNVITRKIFQKISDDMCEMAFVGGFLDVDRWYSVGHNIMINMNAMDKLTAMMMRPQSGKHAESVSEDSLQSIQSTVDDLFLHYDFNAARFYNSPITSSQTFLGRVTGLFNDAINLAGTGFMIKNEMWPEQTARWFRTETEFVIIRAWLENERDFAWKREMEAGGSPVRNMYTAFGDFGLDAEFTDKRNVPFFGCPRRDMYEKQLKSAMKKMLASKLAEYGQAYFKKLFTRNVNLPHSNGFVEPGAIEENSASFFNMKLYLPSNWWETRPEDSVLPIDLVDDATWRWYCNKVFRTLTGYHSWEFEYNADFKEYLDAEFKSWKLRFDHNFFNSLARSNTQRVFKPYLLASLSRLVADGRLGEDKRRLVEETLEKAAGEW